LNFSEPLREDRNAIGPFLIADRESFIPFFERDVYHKDHFIYVAMDPDFGPLVLAGAKSSASAQTESINALLMHSHVIRR
jgi:hypothetical protein